MVVLAFLTEILGIAAIVAGIYLLLRALFYWHKRATRLSAEEEAQRDIEKIK